MSIDYDAQTDHRHWLRNEYQEPDPADLSAWDEDDPDWGYSAEERVTIAQYRADHPDRIVIGITDDGCVLSVPGLTAADIDRFVRTGRLTESEAAA
jgi:hypothetical protein